jgi:transcriptional regulator with XRE-family HTH domain
MPELAAPVLDEKVMVRLRKSLGLSQGQVAEGTNIPQRRLSSWESNKLKLTSEEIRAMAQFFDRILLERSQTRSLPADWLSLSAKDRGQRLRTLHERGVLVKP